MGLIFCFITLPFVWTVVAWNRYKNKIKFNTDIEPIYGDKDGKWQQTGSRPRNIYEVETWETPQTAVGLGWSFLLAILGLFTYGIVFKLFNYDLTIGLDPQKPSIFLVVINLYFIGVISVIFFIALFSLLMALWRFISSFKKELTDSLS